MLDWLLERMAEAADEPAIANGPAVCTLPRAARAGCRLAARSCRSAASPGKSSASKPSTAPRRSRCSWPRPTPATCWCRSRPRSARAPGRLPRDRRGRVPAAARRAREPTTDRRHRAHRRAPATTPRCATRAAPAWCSSRQGRPASTRRRCTTSSALLQEVHRRRATATGRWSSCSSITSAASTRCFYTLVERRRRGRVGTGARRARCARRSRRTASSCCRPRRRSSTCCSSPRSTQRHDLSSLQADHLRHRADAASDARTGPRGVPRGQAAADLRPERARHPAVAVARVRLAVDARRRRGLRDQDRRRPALDPRELGDARLPERAEPVRRRRLLRYRRPGRGRRRVAPHPRPQERDHQRRRQQGVPARGRERAARARRTSKTSRSAANRTRSPARSWSPPSG